MILVTLGTFPTQFQRPLIAIEELCKNSTIREEVIVQNGHTTMESSFLNMRPFIAPEELTDIYKKATLIISHAGTGSLIKGIKLNKKVIAIARLAKYNEHVDDHQIEILNMLAKLNYILPWHENVELSTLLTEIKTFEPAQYNSNKQNIINYLNNYIDSL